MCVKYTTQISHTKIVIKACELNETGYETENDHRGGHHENGQEMIVEMGFNERKMAPRQHNGTSIWGRGHSRGKVSEEGTSLMCSKTEVRRAGAPWWRERAGGVVRRGQLEEG